MEEKEGVDSPPPEGFDDSNQVDYQDEAEDLGAGVEGPNATSVGDQNESVDNDEPPASPGGDSNSAPDAGSPEESGGLRQRKAADLPPPANLVKEFPEDEVGITPAPNSERFVVPFHRHAGLGALDWFLKPQKWGLSEFLRVSVVGTQMLIACLVPHWLCALQFIFWRLMYNLGLGLLLHYQSKYQIFTYWFSKLPKHSLTYALTRRVIVSTMGKDLDYESYPECYRAWLAYREMVDFILPCDLMCYIVFCLRHIEFPETFSFYHVVWYAFAVGMCMFSWWAKKDALRVIKDFAWYWGDFFFLLADQDLKFDGVFEMFPHPMYSVGYSFFYGASIICQSYTVLYVSLFAHFCQLGFLALVETPHITRTYESMVTQPAGDAKEILAPYFRRDLIVFKNFDIYRASDVVLLLLMVLTAIQYFMPLPPVFFVGQVIVWRFIHNFVLGSILRRQSKDGFWNNHYTNENFDKAYAFDNWKRIYNTSLVMTHFSFFICALVYFSAAGWNVMPFMLRLVMGVLLMCINAWSSISTYEVLGDFGWFYGDFFIDEYRPELYYTGIYRFLNNPDSVTGFMGYYGLAIFADSPVVLFLAFLSQVSNAAFVMLVEKPHMVKLYGDKHREDGGISQQLKKGFKSGLTKVAQLPVTKDLLNHPMTKKTVADMKGHVDSIRRTASDLEEKVVKEYNKVKTQAKMTTRKVNERVERVVESVKQRTDQLKEKLLPPGSAASPPPAAPQSPSRTPSRIEDSDPAGPSQR